MSKAPTKLTREDLLVLLIEEAAEVIQAATKCLRFGWDREYPGYGRNDIVLAREVGDFEGVLAALHLDHNERIDAANSKLQRAIMAKAERRDPENIA